MSGKCVTVTGKSATEAVQEACKSMGLGITDVEYEILDDGSKGFLGLGARPARVKVWTIGYDEAAEKAELERLAKQKAEQERLAKEKAEKEKVEKERAEKEAKAKADREAKAKAEQAKAEKPKAKPEPAPKAETVAVEAEPRVERPQITEEDKARVIADAKKFLSEVFATMKLEVEIDAKFIDNKQMTIDLSGPDMGVIIGKRGQTLDSLQHLVGLVVNKGEFAFITVTLDTEDYRKRRKETLEHLAFNLAKKAKHLHKNVVLEPMNPYERRIIHATLQNDRYVTTYSEGVEPRRYVVITPKTKDRGYERRTDRNSDKGSVE
jgi:spoIIIJ-associated protein